MIFGEDIATLPVDDVLAVFEDVPSTAVPVDAVKRAIWSVEPRQAVFSIRPMEELLAAKKRLQDMGVEVLGPADHRICQSIYFHDPSGHRLELAFPTDTAEVVRSTFEKLIADTTVQVVIRAAPRSRGLPARQRMNFDWNRHRECTRGLTGKLRRRGGGASSPCSVAGLARARGRGRAHGCSP